MIVSDNIRGAALMTGVAACFTIGDVCIKAAALDAPILQIVFLRGLYATGLLAAVAWWRGILAPKIGGRDRRLVVLRSLAELGAIVPFFIALANMPIANVVAILQAIPLAMTLAGALILGEPVGWRRLTAILIGFGGVLLIVRPGAADFNAYSLLVLVTVAMVSLRDLTVRRISRGVPAIFAAMVMAGVVTLGAGGAVLLEGWTPLSRTDAPLILIAGTLIVGGYLLSVLAMRWGELGFVTPFRYTALVWALLFGWLVFGEWPDTLTLIGAGIVVGTGLFTLWREGRMARAVPGGPGRM